MDGGHRKEPSSGEGSEGGAGSECEGESVRDGKELANDSQNV